MTKKLAVINDLSGFGRCSLTAAIPTISVMGVQPCPLPTAILSAQTGFASYYYDDYTDKMDLFRQEWEKMNVHFDGIYTGFVANEAQIQQIFRFLDTFYDHDKNAQKNVWTNSQGNHQGSHQDNDQDVDMIAPARPFLLVDPIMGDEGVRFPFCTDVLLEDMKKLVMRADVVTPNLMELCLLTDTVFSKDLTFVEIERRAKMLVEQGVSTVIVTGIRFYDELEKQWKIGNLTVTKVETKRSSYPYIGGSFSGTGDLFASVVAGGIARGDDIFEVVDLAGAFIWKSMRHSEKEGGPRNEGADFEGYLSMLFPNESHL